MQKKYFASKDEYCAEKIPMGKNPCGEKFLRGNIPAGIFPHGENKMLIYTWNILKCVKQIARVNLSLILDP